jgi:hypothetical protein
MIDGVVRFGGNLTAMPEGHANGGRLHGWSIVDAVTVGNFEPRDSSSLATIEFREHGVSCVLRCDFIAGCNRFRGVCRPSIRQSDAR